MKIKVVILIITNFLFTACVSVKGFKGKTDLYGMVCSLENFPIEGCLISLNGHKCFVTNSNGLFIIHNVGSGEIIIKGEKKGWETFEIKENFVDRNKLFCMQIRSLNQVLEQVEKELEKDNYIKAQELLQISEKENEENKRVIIYKAIVSYKLNNFNESISCCKKLKETCVNKNKISNAIEFLQNKKKEKQNESKK